MAINHVGNRATPPRMALMRLLVSDRLMLSVH